MKVQALLLCLVLSLSVFCQSQAAPKASSPVQEAKAPLAAGDAPAVDPAKAADIRRLLDVAGTSQLVSQMMDETIKNIRPLMTNALPPGDYRDQLIDLFFVKFKAKANPAQVIDLAVPIYDRYLSREEVRGLIEFYQTPLGQKTIHVMPTLMAELQQAGRQWGQNLGQDCVKEVLAENPKLATALEEASKASQSH